MGASRRAQTRPITTVDGRSTTRRAFDASAGENGSAKTTPYFHADALVKTGLESVEAMVRKQRALFARFVAHIGRGARYEEGNVWGDGRE